MPTLRALFAVALAATLALPAGAALAQLKPIPIKKIALIECPEPINYAATTGSSGATAFLMGGLIGGTISTVINEENNKKLTEAFANDPVGLGRRITDTIEASLRAASYEVVRVDAARSKPYMLLETYAVNAGDVDAILDVVVTFAGYHRAGLAFNYAPGVRINTKLVAPDQRTEIFSDSFGHGQGSRFSSGYGIGADHTFANMDSLREQLPRAKEALLNGAAPLAQELVARVNDARDGKVSASSAGSDDPTVRKGPDADSTR